MNVLENPELKISREEQISQSEQEERELFHSSQEQLVALGTGGGLFAAGVLPAIIGYCSINGAAITAAIKACMASVFALKSGLTVKGLIVAKTPVERAVEEVISQPITENIFAPYIVQETEPERETRQLSTEISSLRTEVENLRTEIQEAEERDSETIDLQEQREQLEQTKNRLKELEKKYNNIPVEHEETLEKIHQQMGLMTTELQVQRLKQAVEQINQSKESIFRLAIECRGIKVVGLAVLQTQLRGYSFRELKEIFKENQAFEFIVPANSLKIKKAPDSNERFYLELAQEILEIKKLSDEGKDKEIIDESSSSKHTTVEDETEELFEDNLVRRFGNISELRKEYQNSFENEEASTSNRALTENEGEQIFDLSKINKSSNEILGEFTSLTKRGKDSSWLPVDVGMERIKVYLSLLEEKKLEGERKLEEQQQKVIQQLTKSQEAVQSPSFLFPFFSRSKKGSELSDSEFIRALGEWESVNDDQRTFFSTLSSGLTDFCKTFGERMNQSQLNFDQRLTSLQNQYVQEKQEYNRLIQAGEQTLKLKNQELENKEREMATIEEKGKKVLEAKEEERQDLETKLIAKKNDVENKENQINQLEQEKSRLENQIQILQERIRTITLNYQQIARKCQAYEELEAAVQERLARQAQIASPRDRKLSDQEETIALQNALIAKKIIDIKDLKETIRILTNSFQNLHEREEELESEIKDYTEQLQRKESKLKELSSNYQSLKKEKEKISEELTVQKQNYSELESTQNLTKNQLERTSVSLARTQTELNNYRDRFSLLETKKNELDEKLTTKSQELKELSYSFETIYLLSEIPPTPQNNPGENTQEERELLRRLAKLGIGSDD
ncbi:5522_t:CDS:2 [Gigaspora margarita]|uniref:5522_t:CDS:1 n=1 Tax=Gigaspora margarita TaxID=4874 RepID=A0ABN7UCP0_GIGMA|nr:5522_t:CDS:2 [Gigaspora margarita]